MSDNQFHDELLAKAAIDNKTFQSHLIKIISIPVVLIFCLLAYFHFQNEYRNSVDDEIDQFESILFNTLSLEKTYSDMATGVRGYIISGRKELLEPYIDGPAVITDFKESVFRDISGNYELSLNFRKVYQSLKNTLENRIFNSAL